MSGLACPDARHQRLSIGLPGKFDELGAQILLQRTPGYRSPGSEFVAGLIRNVPQSGAAPLLLAGAGATPRLAAAVGARLPDGDPVTAASAIGRLR